jgi:hypothetical protein
LRLTVDILNPTDFPITVKTSVVRLFVPRGGCIKYYMGDDFFLVPKKPHRVEVPITIGSVDWDDNTPTIHAISVEGEFSHFGRLGDKIVIKQTFSGLLQYGIWGTEYFPFTHMNPEVQEEKTQAGDSEQKAN